MGGISGAMGDWAQFGNAPGSFSIEGSDAQVVTLTVPAGDHLVCEPGAMMHSSSNLTGSAECAPSCCQRCCCMGESCFQNKYDNASRAPGYIGLTPSFMAKIIAIDMGKHPQGMIMKNGGYMANQGGVDLALDVDCCSKGCCCGLGPCRQHLTGNGSAFVAAGGTIMEKTLAAGEKIRIDQMSIVGYDFGMPFDMEWAGCCASCCGGECCFATLEGPGQVYMQSMSFEKYQAAVVPKPKQKGAKEGQ